MEVVHQMSHGTFKSLINPGPRMLSSIDFSMLDIFTLAYLRHPNLVSLAMIQYFSTTLSLMMHSKISRTLSLWERQSRFRQSSWLMQPKFNPTSQMEIGWTWTIMLTSLRLMIQVGVKPLLWLLIMNKRPLWLPSIWDQESWSHSRTTVTSQLWQPRTSKPRASQCWYREKPVDTLRVRCS